MRFFIKLKIIWTLLNTDVSIINTILKKLEIITYKEDRIMRTLLDLQAEVAECTEVINGAITLITGLAEQIRDANAQNNPAKIEEICTQLDSASNALAAAIAANTVAAPAPAPAPAPETTPVEDAPAV